MLPASTAFPDRTSLPTLRLRIRARPVKRNFHRGDGTFVTNLAVAKRFELFTQSHQYGGFGKYTDTFGRPPEMQFALGYEF